MWSLTFRLRFPSTLLADVSVHHLFRNDGQVGGAPLASRRYSKLLTLVKQYGHLAVHFLWETLPVVEFVTEFVRSNPDVMILMPSGILVDMLMQQLWHDIDPSRFVVVMGDFRCALSTYTALQPLARIRVTSPAMSPAPSTLEISKGGQFGAHVYCRSSYPL